MYLKINEDIIEAAVARNDERAIEVLTQVAFAIRYGKHAVEITPRDVARLLDRKNLFSRNELAAFNMVGRVYYKLNGFVSRLSIFAVVTFEHETERIDNTIYINPNEQNHFELYEETHLLAENIEDIELFSYMISYFQRKERIPMCKVNFYKMMGGGHTTGDFMEYENILKQHFCFSVVDSDFHYEDDNHLGDTAKYIQEKLIGTPFNCGMYYMNSVCEVENLIPWCAIKSNPVFRNHTLIKYNGQLELSFYDLKDGVHVQYLYSDISYNYWDRVFPVSLRRIPFRTIKADRKRYTKEKFKQKYGDRTIGEGFGTKLLPQSLKIMRDSKKLYTDEDLSSAQQKEWNLIGKEIFAWCCCFSQTNV